MNQAVLKTSNIPLNNRSVDMNRSEVKPHSYVGDVGHKSHPDYLSLVQENATQEAYTDQITQNHKNKKVILSVKGLTKSYNKKGENPVLKNINFDIRVGEYVAIIGRSGAGKSTLLHILNGTIPATSGSIFYENGLLDNVGNDVYGIADITELSNKEMRKWRAKCATIFQDFCLVPRLDVITNVLLGCLSQTSTIKSIFKQFSVADRAKAVALLEWLNMLPHALQRAEKLSGGQMQRVAICRALMQNPELLLADEPVASLDPKNTHRIMEALQKVTESEIPVLVNLHSVELVQQYCTRAIGLARGEIIFDDTPDNLTPDILSQLYGDDLKSSE